MHCWFEEALAVQTVPWLLVRGDRQSRVEQVIGIMKRLWPQWQH
jgi:hypothetical protein